MRWLLSTRLFNNWKSPTKSNNINVHCLTRMYPTNRHCFCFICSSFLSYDNCTFFKIGPSFGVHMWKYLELLKLVIKGGGSGFEITRLVSPSHQQLHLRSVLFFQNLMLMRHLFWHLLKWSGKQKYFDSILCKPSRNAIARLRKDILGHIPVTTRCQFFSIFKFGRCPMEPMFLVWRNFSRY